MKKKIFIVIIALILLFPIPFRLKDGGSIEFRALLYTVTKYHKLSTNLNEMYINGIGIKILGIEIFNNTENCDTNKISSSGKVIISNDKIENIYLLDKFLDNTDRYNKKSTSDVVEIVTYTIEGDEILTTLQYTTETNEFTLIVDNTKDKFASEENRGVCSKVYSNSTYNLVKKIKDDDIYLMLEADKEKEERLEDIVICLYDKNLEKNKDTSRTKIKEVSLTAEETELNQLVRYNGILYGKSYGMIDYAWNPNEPIGTINKLVGEEYLPVLNGETNSEELLNAVVDDVNEKSLILIYNNEAVLYRAIDETKYCFYATVIESKEKYILVEPLEGSQELKSSDKISINLGENNDEIYPVGTIVTITYDGMIMESYPAQINASKIEVKSP
ncbi:MAG: DUF4362 domain-containing protein [Clostridia bacterium]